jgi:hypothetical protein
LARPQANYTSRDHRSSGPVFGFQTWFYGHLADFLSAQSTKSKAFLAGGKSCHTPSSPRMAKTLDGRFGVG